jgi:hypothetical protein
MNRIQTYAEFWPYYLRAHRTRGSRALHYVGTAGSLAAVGLAIVTGSAWWLLAAPLAGYGPAWIGHFLIEHNKPATFGHPFWSLVSDYRMFALALTGRLGPELERAELQSPPAQAAQPTA